MKRLALLLASAAATFAAPGSMILMNCRVYTANDRQPTAEAVLIVDGRIASVGPRNEIMRARPADARVIDLGGRTVLPGLTDAHAHLAGIGFRELNFNLEGATGIADVQAKLRQRVADTPRGKWIVGRGWIETHWTPAKFPTRQDLDLVAVDQPVILSRADGHAVVVNSRALELAHVTRATPDPAGGQVLKDEKGEPTGMLVDRAMDLVRRLVPPPTEEETLKALAFGAAREVQLGWTQVHTMGSSLEELALIRQLMAERKMVLRVYDVVSGPGPAADKLLADGASLGEFDGRLTVRGIKCYIDGALGSRGAALLEPYSDAPDNRGLLVNSEETLLPLFIKALRNGIQVETHAIGDRGNRIMLDLYAKAFAAVPVAQRKVAEPRWRIEHAQILSPADIPRFRQLGVIPSMQPSHAIGDLYFAPQRLGPARLAGAYAWRSLLDTGVVIPGGSDAPVERGEPMIEFYAAVTRKSLDGFSNDDWHREQRVTRAEALKMFTLWPAYAAFQEKERGSIEPGKVADLTVLSDDIMEIPEPEILKARAVMTIIGGDIAWRTR